MKLFSIVFFLLFTRLTGSYAQQNIADSERVAYLNVITKRADKIAKALNIADSVKSNKVSLIIRDQYDNLNNIYTLRDGNKKAAKLAHADDKSSLEKAVAKEDMTVERSLAKLHKSYLSKLSKHLTPAQVDQVKNEMTYNVLPITYRAYQEEILTLNEEQKKQILTWLTEGREHAMDAESADKKHAWFGKYKGRINNYLSAAGYDLKKEGVEWEKRRKASAQTN
jgi:hypothetical protein